jgi:phage shock protein E
MKGPKLLIWGLVAVLALGLAYSLVRPAPAIRQDIGNAALRDLQANGARLVDVRSTGEFAIGHIAGAENVPVEQITSDAAKWDKSAAVIVYCATGARSYNAAQWLAQNGFTKVYNLKAGVESWDGTLTKDAGVYAAGAVKTNGKPVVLDFYGDT